MLRLQDLSTLCSWRWAGLGTLCCLPPLRLIMQLNRRSSAQLLLQMPLKTANGRRQRGGRRVGSRGRGLLPPQWSGRRWAPPVLLVLVLLQQGRPFVLLPLLVCGAVGVVLRCKIQGIALRLRQNLVVVGRQMGGRGRGAVEQLRHILVHRSSLDRVLRLGRVLRRLQWRRVDGVALRLRERA